MGQVTDLVHAGFSIVGRVLQLAGHSGVGPGDSMAGQQKWEKRQLDGMNVLPEVVIKTHSL